MPLIEWVLNGQVLASNKFLFDDARNSNRDEIMNTLAGNIKYWFVRGNTKISKSSTGNDYFGILRYSSNSDGMPEGRLDLMKVDLNDTHDGTYECRVGGKVNSTQVIVGQQLWSPQSTQNLIAPVNEEFKLNCDIRGNPMPTYEWRKVNVKKLFRVY